jgi:minor extracellular serine protease Vpr
VTIGGQVAQVLFSGLAPGYAGLYQVNVQIPSTIAPGDDVPIHISMAGASDTATIAIAGP